MNHRERVAAVLDYRAYGALPIVHFGFWRATLAKWRDEGHISAEEAAAWTDESAADKSIAGKLGFDFNWNCTFHVAAGLFPPFERMVLREHPDGTMEVRDTSGVTVREKRGVTSIPAEIDHLLKDRASWEAQYLPRLRYSPDRVHRCPKNEGTPYAPLVPAGVEYLRSPSRAEPAGLHCGSLLGEIRNWLGIEGLSYLAADDEPLLGEIIDTVGELSYRCVEEVLATGAVFDFAHFWEDICFRSGPLVAPSLLRARAGPHYRRITGLLREHGVTIVSVDCDGRIDALIPAWIENGVNTMFPIEVGVWGGSIAPWRAKYGRALRGVGGVDKRVFARDFAAVDAEIERLKPLVALGGYIPCPDHRLATDAVWDNVRYYCDRMRAVFA